MNKPDLIEAELELFCATALPELRRKCTVNHDVQSGQPFGTTCADVGCSGYLPDCTTDRLMEAIDKLTYHAWLLSPLANGFECSYGWKTGENEVAEEKAVSCGGTTPHLALLKAVAALVSKESE